MKASGEAEEESAAGEQAEQKEEAEEEAEEEEEEEEEDEDDEEELVDPKETLEEGSSITYADIRSQKRRAIYRLLSIQPR